MRAPPRRLALIVASVIAGLLVLLLGAWALDSAVLSGQVARNVRLDGVAVGGLSDSDLRVEVAKIAEQYEAKPVHLITPTGTVDATLMDLGVTVDQQATVHQALAVGRDDPFLLRPVRWLRALTTPRRAPLDFSVNPPQVAARIAALEADDVTDPVEPTLALENGQIVVVPGVPGRSFDTHDLADMLQAAAVQGGSDITLDIAARDRRSHAVRRRAAGGGRPRQPDHRPAARGRHRRRPGHHPLGHAAHVADPGSPHRGGRRARIPEARAVGADRHGGHRTSAGHPGRPRHRPDLVGRPEQRAERSPRATRAPPAAPPNRSPASSRPSRAARAP